MTSSRVIAATDRAACVSTIHKVYQRGYGSLLFARALVPTTNPTNCIGRRMLEHFRFCSLEIAMRMSDFPLGKL